MAKGRKKHLKCDECRFITREDITLKSHKIIKHKQLEKAQVKKELQDLLKYLIEEFVNDYYTPINTTRSRFQFWELKTRRMLEIERLTNELEINTKGVLVCRLCTRWLREIRKLDHHTGVCPVRIDDTDDTDVTLKELEFFKQDKKEDQENERNR